MAARLIIDWVRPHILEAGDGVLTSAGICEGLSGAGVASGVLVFTAAASLIAGGLAMGVKEYSKAAAERDEQETELTRERRQLEASPDAELEELTQLYRSRGLSPPLARQVAIELTAHDALRAHAEAEHGITSLTTPLRVAVAAGASFAAGAALLVLTMLVFPPATRPLGTFLIVVVALALTGWMSARIARLQPSRQVVRTAAAGAVAMVVTYLAGRLIHP